MTLRPVAWACALVCAACLPSTANVPVVDMRFLETPQKGPWSERAFERHPLNVSIIRGARLTYMRIPELLKAAESPTGGSPRLLLRASRALSPGSGVVVLATARGHDTGHLTGSAVDLAVYQLALNCDAADIDAPGDLKGCSGYFLRVARAWPAEAYDVENATVSIIPEGGTARGRMRVKTRPAGFAADVDGEFVSSLIEMGAVGPPLVEAAPK